MDFIKKIQGAGFTEVDAHGKTVKETDYAVGWNGLHEGRRKTKFVHKNGKSIELEYQPQSGDQSKHITLIDENGNEYSRTNTGDIPGDALLKTFFAEPAKAEK